MTAGASAEVGVQDLPVIDRGGQVFNVKAYGARGDRVTEDTVAIENAMNAAVAAGGGIVLFPPGTYICNGAVSPAMGTGELIIQGSGMNSTTLLASKAENATFTLSMPGEVRDVTVSGGGLTTNALVFVTDLANTNIDHMNLRRARCTNIASNVNGWVFVAWDQQSQYNISLCVLEDVEFLGPSSNINDAMTVTYVDTCQVTRLRLINLARTPNFYIINHLQVDGLYSNGCAGVASLVVDSGVSVAELNNVIITYTAAGQVNSTVSAPLCFINNWYQIGNGGLQLNMANNNQVAHINNFHSGGDGISLNAPMGALTVTNSYFANTASNAPLEDLAAAGTTHGPINISSSRVSTGASTNYVVYSAHGTTFSDFKFNANVIIGAYAGLSTGVTYSAAVSVNHNSGFNPVGLVTVAVPATGVAVAAAPYDRTFTITNGTASSSFAVGASTVLTLPASAVGTLFVPAGQTMTPTYTAAPTWTTYGN